MGETRLRAVSLFPPADPAIRQAGRLLAMVNELHKAGYQRLRIAPGMAPSGCHWRCHVTSAGNVAVNGWEPLDWSRGVASYSTGQKNLYFGWDDAGHDSARQLAAKFIERFPEIARAGQGPDWAYAGWYVAMLGAAEHGTIPVFFADYPVELAPDDRPPPP
ncbi:hypothetical protein [Azospirillum picis]|uniref:Uncharacterized protein n=1 Tax=Azospirillum picis TaxID=488438 RepID=A0ABU0MJ78_9PROT|nr:hypothetical protein [Azospirillum picis]MBP2299724.1 hypothetical protein [Azospirillum picis]MDQ0533520.1 hypothetical protein [Azospirillum picis]